MIACRQVSKCWLFVYPSSLLGARESKDLHGNPKLEIYPTVILQLTTISLLLSFSSGAYAVLPAIPLLVMPSSETEAAVVEPAPKEVRAEDYQPITDSKNIERFVTDYFADIPILADIAKCESRFRHLNSSGEVLEGEENSNDRGVMQINLWYHAKTAKKLGLDVQNLDDNVQYARYLYEKEGAKPWMSSSACWAKFKQSEIARG